MDITFLEHLIPRHPALGQIVITGRNVGEVTGREEVSYMCPGSFVRGNHMETNMLRPNIHVPDADEIFRIVLEDCDYRSKTSDKGRYEITTVQKFGGLEKAGYALWSDKHRRSSRSSSTSQNRERRVHRRGLPKERSTPLYGFPFDRKIMEDTKLSYELIDEYVEHGVLYRGYIFGCENCSDAAWHSIAEVDQTFTCNRCGMNQVYKHQHWKTPNEPLWYYKLDEMVYLMLKHNGHVPFLH